MIEGLSEEQKAQIRKYREEVQAASAVIEQKGDKVSPDDQGYRWFAPGIRMWDLDVHSLTFYQMALGVIVGDIPPIDLEHFKNIERCRGVQGKGKIGKSS